MRTHVSSSSNLGPASEDFNDLESPLLRTESQEYSEDHVHDKSGPVRFSANVFKAFVGSGILAIPFGMHEAGLLAGIVSLLFVALVSVHCMLLIVETKQYLQRAHSGSGNGKQVDFGGVGRFAFGSKGELAVNIAVTIAQVGFGIAYLIFAGSNFHSVLTSYGVHLAVEWYILAMGCLIAPLALLRSYKKLAPTSIVANVAIIYGIAVVLTYALDTITRANGGHGGLAKGVRMFNPSTFPVFIGNALFVFEGIGVIIPLEQNMKHPQTFKPLFSIIMAGIATLVLLFGALGYAAYGEATSQSITDDLPDSAFVVVLRLGYAIGLLLTYPVQMFPVIEVFEEAIAARLDGASAGPVKPKLHGWRSVLFRMSTVMFTVAVALAAKDYFGFFTAIIGAVGCSALVFIFPALFHAKIMADSISTTAKYKDYFIALLGIVGGVLSVTVTFIEIINGGGKPPS